MTALGRPLAVASAFAVCDGKGQHEGLLITDGDRAHGHLLDQQRTDLDAASRTGTVVEWVCRGDDTECLGHLRLDLTTPGVWGGNSGTVGLLVDYGTAVER